MKLIQLGGNKRGSKITGYTIVDDDDFDELNKYSWHADSYGYAVRTIYKGGKCFIKMARLIMGNPEGLEVDHINRNKADNRKCNLRVCPHRENQFNKGKNIVNTSGYKGIFWDESRKIWIAKIQCDKKAHRVVGFTTKESAARAYNKMAIEFFGEFAVLNKV